MYKPRYIQYLELPTIPKDIVDYLTLDLDKYKQAKTTGNPYQWTDNGNQELDAWGKKHICPDMYFAFQIMWGHLPMHYDIGTKTKLTYVLETGGDDVVTTFFDADGTTVLDSYCIEPHRWHIFKADTQHSVQNIQPGQFRLSVTARIFS